MDVYVLDTLMRRTAIIDTFISVIWSERYNETGDFELDIYPTRDVLTLLTPGTMLATNVSYRVMVVQTIEDDVDDDNVKTLKITGKSLESIMSDRVAMGSLTDTTTTPQWTITDIPAAIARKIFHDICMTGTLSTDDIIPYVVEDTFMPVSGIAEPVDPVTVAMDPTDVYTAIQQICSTYNLGFRMLRNDDMAKIWWDVYSGTDRTSGQALVPAVIFSPELDNLQNTKELTSIDTAKNVAYVFSPAGYQTVYAPNVDPDVAGFDRKVLVVNATDISIVYDTDGVTPIDQTETIMQRGYDELANYRTVQSLDGEISQDSQYKYGRDFELGDLVEERNSDGVANIMRVTEQIHSQDSDGYKSYPTLVVAEIVTTGSWLSWPNNRVWTDFGDTEYWDTQP